MKFFYCLSVLIAVALTSCGGGSNKGEARETDSIIVAEKPVTLFYGFNVDSFNIRQGKITEGL